MSSWARFGWALVVGSVAFLLGYHCAAVDCVGRSRPAVIQPQRFDRVADSDAPEEKPCATSMLLVYPGLDAADVKEIQAEVDKFMAQVRAKCVKEEGA